MNEETYIRNLAKQAQEDIPPDVNVAPRVMAAIRERESQYHAGLSPLAWMAGCSGAVALVVAFFAISEFIVWNNPIMQILEVLTWGML